MKKYILTITLLFCLFSGIATAQSYTQVDEKVKTYPQKFSSIEKLAEQINSDFTKDDEKARAIFTWLALHIQYAYKAFGANQKPIAYTFKSQEEKLAKEKKFNEDLALKTLRTRKAVCQGYATLYMLVAEQVGLEAQVVSGTSKAHYTHIGRVPSLNTSDHAWNVVKIDGEWKLIDVTWAAGSVTGNPPKFEFDFNDKYFFTSPEVFFLNHYPDDEKWLMLNASKDDFTALPLYFGNAIREGYKFLVPNIGTLTSDRKTGLLIPFKVENLKPQDRVDYVYSSERVFKNVTPTFSNGVATFSIPLERNYSGYLTVYINGESAISYRVTRQ
ncbi:hypothetical protein GCM10007424_01670 [Flavobacterium suaedae]|uniref:Transglutaminase-like domain-containing protein n=1 Tax=Flavobacterium suaedae TaxID=1767027 RepID=A0ABQ1JGG1_9FLAO|nr:transglutaminase domain-containing protein [Flavobacterium suaedae]GGB65400.1 hypothetical protein GCM10007424_01670 [Flavobacterium suaedae]